MLGIDDKTMKQIAAMPTEHSWLAPRILESEDLDELEDSLWKWLKPKANALMKDKSNDHSLVWRMVRDGYIPLLENAAIAEFLNQNPNWMGYLPEVSDQEDAAYIASLDLNWVKDEQIKEAGEILESLQQEVMPPSKQASSDSES